MTRWRASRGAPGEDRCGRGLSPFAALFLLAASAGADDWPGPRALHAFSDDGSQLVRVLPGESFGDAVGFAGAPKGRYARAERFARQADRSYRLIGEVELLNPVAPVEVLLSDRGYLVTLDNWHNLGYGKIVAIYGPTGGAIASYELDQLFEPEELARIRASVSSRWWRCPPLHFVAEQAKVYVGESLGGHFVFDLATGAFTHVKGSRACQQEGHLTRGPCPHPFP